MELKVFLSGEIHTDWREEIVKQIKDDDLAIRVLAPITDHELSDSIGTDILGSEDSDFWKDHKSSGINALRIGIGIKQSDVVIVKFGEKFRQWNAAFDAGYAVAMGKHLIVIHPEEFDHALKEVDSMARAVARNPKQVVEILRYISQ